MTSDAQAPTREAAERVPGVPSNSGGQTFREPWEAQAFAMTVALHERGLFTWPEWTTVLAAEIKDAQDAGDPDTGDSYYRHWLAALERILTEKSLTDPATFTRYRSAWERAADRTPHGTPIELTPQDFG
jgi:nitrile hydratase accessory protein